MKKFKSKRGIPYPFGATPAAQGVNFALFSKAATQVTLVLFRPQEQKPIQEIAFDPLVNKTGSVWHLLVVDLPLDYHYGYRVFGPYDPLHGHYFDNRLVVLDPYAKELVSPTLWQGDEKRVHPHIHKAVIAPSVEFDWGEERFPRLPPHELIIYEMHVRGFTQDPSSQVTHRGCFSAIIEKIPYLKSLGINALELMPVHEFNEQDNLLTHPETGKPLQNYWGYSTLNFFSPMNRYGTGEKSTLLEFKELVKQLHLNGIEVILDVVYNHTAEGNKEGPIMSFKGIENAIYYMLGPNGEYYNFSGCGNTFNCNHPVVRELIHASLRYWVVEMHVDGFRFDLASILVRSHDGIPLAHPPLIEALAQDPILAQTKLIAEAWDAGGLYQVGSFPAMGRWAEWNGKYRDDVRAFIKGSNGMAGSFATRISGSEDLYGKGRLPYHSINYITAHDGFTLADLVSYNNKHNEVNGENNRDGDNNNQSWNCGVEGPTKDPQINSLRERQRKNFLVALLISQGVPMLLMGDEYGHTKNGNNNTWGHDSQLNWFQWDMLEKAASFFRFYKMMIAFRKNHPVLMRPHFLRAKDIVWHGVEPEKPDWTPISQFIACALPDHQNNYTLYIAFNASHQELTIQLPPPPAQTQWHQYIYTFLPSPQDIMEAEKSLPIPSLQFKLQCYSSLVLKNHPPPHKKSSHK